MDKKFAFQIPSQIPEYISDSGPLLSEFLRLYYEYVEQRKNATGLVRYHAYSMDIDTSLSEYIDRFYSIRANRFPNKPKLGKSQLIKLLNEIYDSKGTEKSYKLLFRVLFGEEIVISHPGDIVLRASDGRWKQPNFITVNRIIDVNEPPHPATPFDLTVETGSGSSFDIKVTGVELVDDSTSSHTYRYYFANNTITPFENTNWLYTNIGTYQYTVSLVKVYTKLRIVTPGKKWRVGQVFKIPHDVSTAGTNISLHHDTIARVTRIDTNGGIVSAEVIEYGWPHNTKHAALVSPYPESSRPPGSVTDIYTNLLENNDGSLSYEHIINLYDQIDTSEYLTGLFYQTGSDPSNYFAEDYIVPLDGYTGNGAFLLASSQPTVIQDDPSLSLEEWLLSRASVALLPEYVSRSRGVYSGDNGKLSNQNVRLQDNYYYQLFSYVIETEVDVKEYAEAIKELHPAGLKRFSKLNKVARAYIDYDVRRSLSNDRIDLLDVTELSDDNTSVLIKPLSDQLVIDENSNTNVIKYFTDSVTMLDGNTVVDLGLYLAEDYTLEKYTSKEISISIS
jgi:hypothetical protein